MTVEMPDGSTLALHSEAMAHKPDLLACAYRRIERLEGALNECVAVFESKEMLDVWTYLHVHGIEYKGPYVDLVKARFALAKDSGGKG